MLSHLSWKIMFNKIADNEVAAIQWFMGQVARPAKGKADPNVTKELIVKALEERRK